MVNAKLLKMFVYVLTYFAVVSLIGIVLVHSDASSPVMLTFMGIGFVSFLPIFILVGNKLFLWEAQVPSPVSEDEMRKLLSEFKVAGLAFSFGADNGAYLLSPFEYSMQYSDTSRKRVKYYSKVWLDVEKKQGIFRDYLVEDTVETFMSNFSAGRTARRGLISFAAHAVSSDGANFTFSTNAVHNELINTFVRNGWSARGKPF